MGGAVVLLTDFGTSDHYVGVMKGVIQRITPQAALIDLTHHIEPQNVRQAAFTLLNSVSFFAPYTTFLVVVDPGVGGTRKPIAAQAGEYQFVAPDNGVLSYILSDLGEYKAVELAIDSASGVSYTFHGRDVFAPAAAQLAAGAPLSRLGAPLTELMTLRVPELTVSDKRVRGEIVHIDRFGNLITSIGSLRWRVQDRLTLEPRFTDPTAPPVTPIPVPVENASTRIAGQSIISIQRSYSEALRGDLLNLVGSSGFLEIAVNQGSAAVRLDAHIGDPVDLILE